MSDPSNVESGFSPPVNQLTGDIRVGGDPTAGLGLALDPTGRIPYPLLFTSTTLTLAAGTTDNLILANSATPTTMLFITPGAGGSTLTGVTGGSEGRRLVIVNNGNAADSLLLQHAGASATGNAFLMPISGAPAYAHLMPGMLAEFVYTNGWWYLVSVTSGDARNASDYIGGQLNVTLSADQNNYAPAGIGSASWLRVTCAAARIITGLLVGGGATNSSRRIVIQNAETSAATLTLASNSASSGVANRFYIPADIVLAAGDFVELSCDQTSGRWAVAKGGSPTGTAGGALSGTYPNPTLAATIASNQTWTGTAVWSNANTSLTIDPTAAPLTAFRESAGTTDTVGVLTLGRRTTGTAAAGLGARFSMTIEDDAGSDIEAARLAWDWTSAATGVATAEVALLARNAGTVGTRWTTTGPGEFLVGTSTALASGPGVTTPGPVHAGVHGTLMVTTQNQILAAGYGAVVSNPFEIGSGFTYEIGSGATLEILA